ncbi:hypothetical protein DPMN_037372 [Dreissena polymorpha]|uniref:Uncharacterized protein n=1 Tax=Dreissena polymorpha TaxID=45954 RepID=A0A9D4MDA1_DREPO|nr:hypothetical protein DPMN_037372 [Dreissena polymorpha]
MNQGEIRSKVKISSHTRQDVADSGFPWQPHTHLGPELASDSFGKCPVKMLIASQRALYSIAPADQMRAHPIVPTRMPNGGIVTSQAAPNSIWISAFGFGPYTVWGCLAGHYSAIGPSRTEVEFNAQKAQKPMQKLLAAKINKDDELALNLLKNSLPHCQA